MEADPIVGIEFFRRATDEGAMDVQNDLDAQLDGWSIERDAFMTWIQTYAEQFGARELPKELEAICLLLAGFEFGYKAALEVETQRILANGADRW